MQVISLIETKFAHVYFLVLQLSSSDTNPVGTPVGRLLQITVALTFLYNVTQTLPNKLECMEWGLWFMLI